MCRKASVSSSIVNVIDRFLDVTGSPERLNLARQLSHIQMASWLCVIHIYWLNLLINLESG